MASGVGWLEGFIYIGLIVAIIYAIVAFVWPVYSGDIQNILAISPTGFLLVIICGGLAFAGYILWSIHLESLARVCVNLAPVLLFVGSFIIELVVFKTYFQATTTLSLSKCTETFKISAIEEVPKFLTCIFTGYYPSADISFSSVAFITFAIFFWLLPFIFLYYFLYGLLESTVTPMFGTVGPTVIRVLTFIIATYGARQMIGAFLIDFFAYGSWGLVGLFIPLALTAAIKQILQSLIPTEIKGAEVWRTVGIDLYAKLREAEKEAKHLEDAVEQAKIMGDAQAVVAAQQAAKGFVEMTDQLAQGARAAGNNKVAAAFEAVRDAVKKQHKL